VKSRFQGWLYWVCSNRSIDSTCQLLNRRNLNNSPNSLLANSTSVTSTGEFHYLHYPPLLPLLPNSVTFKFHISLEIMLYFQVPILAKSITYRLLSFNRTAFRHSYIYLTICTWLWNASCVSRFGWRETKRIRKGIDSVRQSLGGVWPSRAWRHLF